MAAQVKLQSKANKTSSSFSKAQSRYVSNPVKSFGIVNVDNISDIEFELVNEIAEASISRQIQWESQSFIAMLASMMSKKEMKLVYKGRYNGLNVEVTSNIKGKTTVKVTKGFTKKVLVETFITSRPVVKYGRRIGTARSQVLYNLYKSARYQVDGDLLAS